MILRMVRKFRHFLKDELASTAMDYALFAAGLAVVVITAVKPERILPLCPACGLPMRFVKTIAKFDLHPELRVYACTGCRKTNVEEQPIVDEFRLLEKARAVFSFWASGFEN